MYIKVRSNKFYYRRIPAFIRARVGVSYIKRPLSTDKKLSLQIASKYNDIFTIIYLGLKLGQDVSAFITKLNIQPKQEKVLDNCY